MELFLAIVALATLLFAFLTWLQGRANERRGLEARNVVWSRKLSDDKWQFLHSGSTHISEVKIVLTVAGHSEITSAEELAPDTPLTVENREHANLLHMSREADAEYERELSEYNRPSTGRFGMFENSVPMVKGLPPMAPLPRNITIAANITWRYPSGVPDMHEMTWVDSY